MANLALTAAQIDAALSAALGGGQASWQYDQKTGPTLEVSVNVTSVTSNVTGDFTVNLTNAFVSAQTQRYGAVAMERAVGPAYIAGSDSGLGGYSTTGARFNTRDAGGTLKNAQSSCVGFGALA